MIKSAVGIVPLHFYTSFIVLLCVVFLTSVYRSLSFLKRDYFEIFIRQITYLHLFGVTEKLLCFFSGLGSLIFFHIP